ncbi:non-specific serine/threonine protein kinase [Ranunculus cassubicifolius]
MTIALRPLFYLYLIFLLCSLNQFFQTKAISNNETDFVSLLAIKDNIEGLNSWNQSVHFCKWQGITCGKRHQRVVALSLPKQSLSGTLSPSIGNLSFLRFLDFSDNKFHGIMPEEIGRLFRLQHLNLSDNSFEGQIPVNLSQCTDLRRIDFIQNNLTGNLPTKLGSLSKLEFLALEENKVTGEIPRSFRNLSSLKTFSLVYNDFEGNIPDIFGRLSSLTFLSIGANRFSGNLPASIYNISSLETLGLNGNQLTGSLPPNIFITLPNLFDLSAAGNQLSGPLPLSFANASNLGYLDIASNNLTGDVPANLGVQQNLLWVNFEVNHLGRGEEGDLNFITSLTNSSSLKLLSLMMNNFGGVFPNSIANLSNQIETLNLGTNKISGIIPEGIGNLVSLTKLLLFENQFHGSIPFSIGKLQSLSVFGLYGNNITGLIPSSIGNMTQLYLFSLANNKLHGRIPSNLKNCQNLQSMDLSNNNLNGAIPEKVIGISSLISVDLSRNSLTGFLPLTVGDLVSLGEFGLSQNKLSGEIPSALGNCESLEVLYMDHNQFEGPIPESLGSLKGLKVFDVSSNNLSGQIPQTLENLPYLESLNLSSNKLEGEVPMKGVFRNASAISLDGNSKLCGGHLDLRLPTCQVKVSKKRGRKTSPTLAITISISLFFILASAIVILCWRRKAKLKRQSSTSKGDGHLNVTYRDIYQATSGFSPANLIGSGGFGHVYKGMLNHDEMKVAIKVFNLQQAGGLKSFTAECESLRNIRHRNLVKILTSCSSTDFQGNDFKALVFEFMPNGNLEDWLHQVVTGEDSQSKKLNLLQRLNATIDVASALSYLHHECHVSIVHRDLKPSNVLLDDNLVAHVGDFGLAKILSESTENFYQSQSTFASVNGSIGYIAPEYGAGGEASTNGDVYSFGILVLEMFTGRRPTDDLFKDGLNLHVYASKSLPEQVIRIVDPVLLSEEDETINGAKDDGNQTHRRTQVSECLTAIIRIGVACSLESPPAERMDTRDVIRELHAVRDTFIGTRIYRETNEHETRNN